MTNVFAKYIKVKDQHKAHAVLSASGSERWLGCPASVQLSAGRPNIESESAILGTNAHTLLQFILENGNWRKLLRKPESSAFKNHIGFSDDQLQAVLVAVDYIIAESNRMFKRTGVEPQMHIEQKVKLDGVGFGTSDIMLYQPFGLLHVMDYKNGKYAVSPQDNTQGLYYAVAAADKFGWDFSNVWITIIQPNIPRGPSVKTWKTTPERLEKAKIMFHRGAKRTKAKNPAIIPNHKYCWFCPAKPICPAQMADRESKVMSKFERR